MDTLVLYWILTDWYQNCCFDSASSTLYRQVKICVMLVAQVLVSKCTLWSSTETLRDRGWPHFLSLHFKQVDGLENMLDCVELARE